jgi:uroporphyrinogen-III decarboxylase
MFDQVIDTIQNGKKQFVNMFVHNDTVAKAMNEFVDAQTAYTKNAAKAGQDFLTVATSETVKAVKDAGKFDYTKFGEGIMKAYQSQTAKK